MSIENEKHEAQLQLIRQGLIASIGNEYTKFINFIRTLPINQNLPQLQHAFYKFDDGILWIKEILLTQPLYFPEIKKEDEVKEEIKEEIKSEEIK